ncbi:MAG TPA: class I SAM-dependent methyltransferase [Solirubrobacteraceae bacterium]|nr:class I SAM-dependent methyltransferase [Solirubrobacteraceae bacterium]
MGAVTDVRELRALVGETSGGTGPARGQELYEFVRRERPVECLELGFAHGGGSTWIAAALEANGEGRLTSVDLLRARDYEPSAQATVDRAGLGHRVELVYEQTSYTWYLKRLIRERTRDGACEPCIDFCFVDGAHNWDVDGFAFLLVDKLLKPGGWLLFDDLPWTVPDEWEGVPDEQRGVAQVQEVFDLLVAQHPGYDHLETDGRWGWARKSLTAAPQVRTVIRRDVPAVLRQAARAARGRLRG